MTPERWQQIKDVLHAALDREASERVLFLAEACAGDPSLREEVESLLAVEESAAHFIETPAAEVAAADFTDDSDGSDKSIVGERIGPYQVLREIGRGGMGAVYLAVRADDEYQKRVAIKLVRQGLGSQPIVRRFRHERQILAGLDHPNIAKLLDGGTTKAGLPYFVMDYVEGFPIDVYCDTHKLSTIERLKLFRTVCAAVHYAHQNLIVHRDIKPSNILITADGVPKLLDFGIAKLLNPDLSGSSHESTVLALRPMTPAYASPEQVCGETITTASDTYSLGVLLYELLTGHRPYRFHTYQPQEIERVLREQEPERPSTVIRRVEEVPGADGMTRTKITPETVSRTRDDTPAMLRRRLTGDLDNIVLMALRKEPRRRYTSVEQFSEDIQNYLKGLPIVARKGTLGYRSGKFIRRHRAGVIAAALAAVALLTGTVVAAWQARVARAQRAFAEAQRAIAERRFNDVRQLAHSLLFELHDAIEHLAGSTSARELLVKRALEYLDNLAHEAGDDSSLQRELATAYQKVADIQGYAYGANLGDAVGAVKNYRKALAIREALLAKDPTNAEVRSDLIPNLNKLGDMAWAAGNLAEALANYQKALTINQGLIAEDPGNIAKQHSLSVCYERIGDTLVERGDPTGALENQRKAMVIRETLTLKEPANTKFRRNLSVTYEKIGDALLQTGDTAGALEYYRRTLAMREALAAVDPLNASAQRDLGLIYNRIGATLAKIGDLAGAIVNTRKAQTIYQALTAADPLNVYARRDLSFSYNKVGEVLAKTGDIAGAMESHRQALAISEVLSAKDPTHAGLRSDISVGHTYMGDLLMQTGDLAGALDRYRKALVIREALAEKNPSNAENRIDLAVSYAKLGKAYKRLASGPTSRAGRRMDDWQAAQSWYRRSLDVLLAMRRRGTLTGSKADLLNEVTRELAQCDAALAKRRGAKKKELRS